MQNRDSAAEHLTPVMDNSLWRMACSKGDAWSTVCRVRGQCTILQHSYQMVRWVVAWTWVTQRWPEVRPTVLKFCSRLASRWNSWMMMMMNSVIHCSSLHL